uniref:Uncharacterized protein n=1 Tax=Plectus sambesii TaxID=2011161 RepID=A0A914WQG2_9BILA
MNCQQHVLLFGLLCFTYAIFGVFAFEKKPIEQSVRVSNADRTVRSVNIEELRSLSIDAYMTGGESSLQGTGYTEKELAITAVIVIVMASLVLMCATFTCSKHLMRDFYRMHKT